MKRLPKRPRRHRLCHRACVSVGTFFLYRSPSAAANDDVDRQRSVHVLGDSFFQSTSSMPLQQFLQSTTCPACLCHRVSTGTCACADRLLPTTLFKRLIADHIRSPRHRRPITVSPPQAPSPPANPRRSTVAPDRLFAYVQLAYSAAHAEACPWSYGITLDRCIGAS